MGQIVAIHAMRSNKQRYVIKIFIHRLGRRKHARKQATRKIEKKHRKKYLSNKLCQSRQTSKKTNFLLTIRDRCSTRRITEHSESKQMKRKCKDRLPIYSTAPQSRLCERRRPAVRGCRRIGGRRDCPEFWSEPAHDDAVTSLAATVSTCLRARIWLIHKPEIHNVSQRRQRRTEPRPRVTCAKLAKIGRARSSGDMLAGRQTRASQYSAFLHRGRSKKVKVARTRLPSVGFRS